MEKEKRMKLEKSPKGDSATKAISPSGTPILVVEDDQAVRVVLSTLLSRMGYQVTQAANGAEALDLFSRRSYGAVLTDFQMPGMDGFTLASNIKSTSPKTPVIMITGSKQSLVYEKMKKGFVDSLLFKPFKTEDIHETVRVALTGGLDPLPMAPYLGEAQRGECDEKGQA